MTLDRVPFAADRHVTAPRPLNTANPAALLPERCPSGSVPPGDEEELDHRRATIQNVSLAAGVAERRAVF